MGSLVALLERNSVLSSMHLDKNEIDEGLKVKIAEALRHNEHVKVCDFQATIDHTQGSYGVSMQKCDEGMRIVVVDPIGLIGKWNSQNVGSQIKAGDFIV